MAITRLYKKWLGALKEQIQRSRLQSSITVNTNMLLQYWFLGKQIVQKSDVEGWGATVIEQLTNDLQLAFPDMRGFSVSNLLYMKQFAAVYPDLLITQQPVAQFNGERYCLGNPLLTSIPWGHHTYLLDKIHDPKERLWYIQKTVENNWSRALLHYQVSTDLYLRQQKTKKASNFHLTLPKPQADLASKDYIAVDFALASISHPIGVSEYTFSKALPAKLKNKLPTAAQLQHEVKVFYKKLKTVK